MEISDILIFISFIIAVSLDKDPTVKEDEILLQKRRQLECVEETRVDPDLVFEIKKGRWKGKPSPLIKEWALCVLMKAGLMTAQGVYRLDNALAKVPEDDADEVEYLIDLCLSTKAIPAVDIAYNFIKCYQQTEGYYTLVSAL